MKTSSSPFVLLGLLFALVQLAFGIPLVPATENAIPSSNSIDDAKPASIIVRNGPLGTCVDVWEFGRMNRFTPGNPSRSMLNVCTPPNTCIQPDAEKGWTHFRSLGFTGRGTGCLIFTQENCGEGQTFDPKTDEMQVVDEWAWGVNQGDEMWPGEGKQGWRSLKCWRTETEKRDAVVSGPVDDAASAPVVARHGEVITVSSGPDSEVSDIGSGTVLPRFEPLGTCIDVYEGSGQTGGSQRNLCTPFNDCGRVAFWADGIKSMSFKGATTCNLYTSLNCSGNKLLQINADSPGVNMDYGLDFRLGGPWMSFQCGRSW